MSESILFKDTKIIHSCITKNEDFRILEIEGEIYFVIPVFIPIFAGIEKLNWYEKIQYSYFVSIMFYLIFM